MKEDTLRESEEAIHCQMKILVPGVGCLPMKSRSPPRIPKQYKIEVTAIDFGCPAELGDKPLLLKKTQKKINVYMIWKLPLCWILFTVLEIPGQAGGGEKPSVLFSYEHSSHSADLLGKLWPLEQ